MLGLAIRYMNINNDLHFQKDRFDKEAKSYTDSHGSRINQSYRDLFIRNKLFNFDLKGKKILDAMCATGVETEFLLSKTQDVIGLDISPKCC